MAQGAVNSTPVEKPNRVLPPCAAPQVPAGAGPVAGQSLAAVRATSTSRRRDVGRELPPDRSFSCIGWIGLWRDQAKAESTNSAALRGAQQALGLGDVGVETLKGGGEDFGSEVEFVHASRETSVGFDLRS